MLVFICHCRYILLSGCVPVAVEAVIARSCALVVFVASFAHMGPKVITKTPRATHGDLRTHDSCVHVIDAHKRDTPKIGTPKISVWGDESAATPIAAGTSNENRMKDSLSRFLKGVATWLQGRWSSWCDGTPKADVATSHRSKLQIAMETVERQPNGAANQNRDTASACSGEALAPLGSPLGSQSRVQSATAGMCSELVRQEIGTPDCPQDALHVGDAADPVSVTQAADRVLVVAVVAKRREQAQQQYKHGGRVAAGSSIPLSQRRHLPSNHQQFRDGQWKPSNRHTPWLDGRPELEGNDIGILFALLIHHMRTQGLLEKMPEKPRVVADDDHGDLFHSQYWKKFLNAAVAPWSEMTPQQKRTHLRSWLFKKFSMDPRGECMLPGLGAKRKIRNEASWRGFEINDTELGELVQAVMDDYFRAIGGWI